MKDIEIITKLTMFLAAAQLSIEPANIQAAPYATGDILVCPSANSGPILWFSSLGISKGNLGTTHNANYRSEGAFDAAGNFLVTVFDGASIDKYNNSGVYQTNFAANADPESIVFDQNGNFYVSTSQGGDANGVYRHNSSGTQGQGFLNGVQVDWMDLASDGETLFYTTEAAGKTRNVYQVNLCSGAQPTVFATLGDGGPTDHGKAWQLRLLPSGGMLVADDANVKRLDSSGNIVQTYSVPNVFNLWVLALAANGTQFWVGSFTSANMYLFDIASPGMLRSTVNTGMSGVGGLAIYGSSSWGAAGGGLDTAFNPGTGANDSVYAVQTNGDKVLIGGAFTSYNGTSWKYLARLNANGTLDTSFADSTTLNGNVYAIAVQPTDGKILAGGDFTLANGQTAGRITRFTSTGAIDNTFTAPNGANATVAAIAAYIDSNNNLKIIVGGAFTTFSGATHNYIVRLNANGSVDTSYTPSLGDFVESIAMQSNGQQIIGGEVNLISGHPYYARLNSNGTLDNGFGNVNLGGPVLSVQLQNGQAIVGGGFSGGIRRLTTGGLIDSSFTYGTGANNTVYGLTLNCDGTIFVGGFFTSYNGSTRNHVAKLNSNGTINTFFDPGVGANNNVSTVALQSDGALLIGGAFTQVDGTSRNHIARLTGH